MKQLSYEVFLKEYLSSVQVDDERWADGKTLPLKACQKPALDLRIGNDAVCSHLEFMGMIYPKKMFL